MKPCTFFAIFISLLLFADPASAADQYYKCVTNKGTTFSQFPCSEQATEHKLTVSPNVTPSNSNHVKVLNSLEREQIIRNLNAEIRSVKHKLAILSRDRDRAEYSQQQRLNRLMSDDEKRNVSKDIKKQIKVLNKTYAKNTKAINKQLSELEKKLKRYD
ncbi:MULTISPECIES: DUF4124 domain-containing protein [Pseudoalteromonas]|uniref:DUF4124 domain-containing protein n=1 Tax=Pseudoalteromonas haloplanktis TaxID=228 RepID=A0ABU1B7S3_PSEHA|nr:MULTISPECIES: DUF4124 domain-containing protein [Pseudoalteromonas]MCF6143109.1 hypothetical protein [Pseudoalteromonas mariniglutinosa NCIMB 1770]MDQ9090573.1 DUF4124 domain-containing protein [Pseudoalteromonas haloplanktis]BDF94146.1 hypothetical protein KAN5_09840 [Pseudoalteromonas sp. KAN5]